MNEAPNKEDLDWWDRLMIAAFAALIFCRDSLDKAIGGLAPLPKFGARTVLGFAALLTVFLFVAYKERKAGVPKDNRVIKISDSLRCSIRVASGFAVLLGIGEAWPVVNNVMNVAAMAYVAIIMIRALSRRKARRSA